MESERKEQNQSFKDWIIDPESFLHYVEEEERMIKKLQEKNLDETCGYVLAMALKITTMAKSFACIVALKDQNTARAILRMLADNVCVINIICSSENKDERDYRLLLYQLDGYKSRIEALDVNECEISKETFQNLKSFECTLNEEIRLLREKLQVHPYAKRYPKFHKWCIDNKSWKYIRSYDDNEFDLIQQRNKEQQHKVSLNYTWTSLYMRLHNNKVLKSMLVDCSQNVHGLSISNTLLSEDNESLLNILRIAELLLADMWMCLVGMYK